jgi:hypothetical protein
MVKFKFMDLDDAIDKCRELDEYEPYIQVDTPGRGYKSYTVMINSHEMVWEFCEHRRWHDDRPRQQQIMNNIKDFLQTRFSLVGMKARM